MPRGQAGAGTRVVTEQQQRTVPIGREELRVEREPIPAEDGDGHAELAPDERTMPRPLIQTPRRLARPWPAVCYWPAAAGDGGQPA